MGFRILFRPDFEKDISVWQGTLAKKTNDYGHDWLKNIPDSFDMTKSNDEKYVRNFVEENFYSDDTMKKRADELNKTFPSAKVEENLFEITGKHIPFESIRAFPTTAGRCPYNFNKGYFWYRSNATNDQIIMVAHHELQHIIIHIYFWDMFKDAGLDDYHANQIKEALTVLNNPYLKQISSWRDGGYERHRELRAEIEAIASDNHKGFADLLTRVIVIYKEKYQKLY